MTPRGSFGPIIPCTLAGALVGLSLPHTMGVMTPVTGAVIGLLVGWAIQMALRRS